MSWVLQVACLFEWYVKWNFFNETAYETKQKHNQGHIMYSNYDIEDRK